MYSDEREVHIVLHLCSSIFFIQSDEFGFPARQALTLIDALHFYLFNSLTPIFFFLKVVTDTVSFLPPWKPARARAGGILSHTSPQTSEIHFLTFVTYRRHKMSSSGIVTECRRNSSFSSPEE